MPSPTTCHDIFKNSREKRKAHPLSSGGYKLREAEDRINQLHKLVTTIADRVRAGGKFEQDESLGPCMATERGAYLKGIPAQLAELLGYTILPAIKALEGDGVPKAEVQRLLNHAETDAQLLIDECEALRLRLKGGIKNEYDRMRRGESGLLSSINEIKALARAYRRVSKRA
jgi:hypothetical protein